VRASQRHRCLGSHAARFLLYFSAHWGAGTVNHYFVALPTEQQKQYAHRRTQPSCGTFLPLVGLIPCTALTGLDTIRRHAGLHMSITLLRRYFPTETRSMPCLRDGAEEKDRNVEVVATYVVAKEEACIPRSRIDCHVIISPQPSVIFLRNSQSEHSGGS
jgi:hypothetical protein